MLSLILSEATKELSKAINIIWNQQTLKDNLEKLKSNPELGSIKARIDYVQEMLIELQIYTEQLEAKLSTAFYWLEA